MLSEKELRTLGRKLTDKYIRENLSIDLSEVEGKTLRERLYNYFHPGPHLCAVCGNPVKFISFSKGYREYCSTQCQISVRAEKMRKTCLERYGRTFPKNVDKAKQTCLERYGVEHASQAQTIKDKAKQTCLERYGRTTGLNLEKSKMTCLERYGVEYTSQIPDVIKKSKQTKLDRYGDAGYNNRAKAKQTCLERYGVEHGLQNATIKQRIRKTIIVQYGGMGNASPKILSKVNQTNLERHGAIGYNNRAKAKQTCLERYGVPNATMIPEVRGKMARTCMERYGANIYAKAVAMENNPDIISSEGGVWVCKCPHPECNRCTERTYETTSPLYNDRARRGAELCTRLMPIQSLYSSYELAVRNWLDDRGISYDANRRDIIAPKELDIYLPDFNIAIEINGCYWHSINEKPKNYHYDKYVRCQNFGITLIQLWEDWIRDDFDSVSNLLEHHLFGTELNVTWDNNLVDLGLGSGEIIEHRSIHGGFECWDSGIFIP